MKRLKKHQFDGKSVQRSESRRADESRFNLGLSHSYRENPEIGPRDECAKSISIKFKKSSSEERSSKRDRQARDSYHQVQHHLEKSMRGPPPLEIGPKRLKVRVPLHTGSECKLD